MGTLTESELYCDVEDKLSTINISQQTENTTTSKESIKLQENEQFEEYYEDDFDDDVDDEDEDYFYPEETNVKNQMHSNTQTTSNKISSYQPSEKLFTKYSHKINIDKYSLPTKAASTLEQTERKIDNERMRLKDKQDRATAEQVMDPRTRMILFKLLNRNMITEINGCISTGKEANVYHAVDKEDKQFAIKIFKTSILVFKDRDKYVSGEFRFRHGYCRHNPRKMVKTWAEKEMRNLVRMHNNKLNVPEPILLRSHVLVMSFIGNLQNLNKFDYFYYNYYHI